MINSLRALNNMINSLRALTNMINSLWALTNVTHFGTDQHDFFFSFIHA